MSYAFDIVSLKKSVKNFNSLRFSYVDKIENSVFYQKKKELEAQKRISIKMSQFRHNYNARVVGTISLLSRR